MLSEFQKMLDGHPGRINITKHRIKFLPESFQPVYLAPYSAGPKKRELEKVKIDKMIAEKVIESAQIEWAALNVLASKKDGDMQFYVYYRRLNASIKRDSYPSLCMDEFF